jgi:YegS/Rv2252/BmrU family lipid kinase
MNGLFFIINPAAGHGRAMRIWKKVKNELKRMKVSYRSFYTEYHGHAEVLARQIATIQDYHLKTIIGVGGDGTIHEIVNGLSLFTNIQIGLISSRSGHDFSRGFQLPNHPVKAIRLLLQRLNKPVKQYDLGYFHLEGKKSGHYFIKGLEIGLYVEVEKTLKNSSIKRLMSMLHMEYVVYIITLIKVLLHYQPFTMDVRVDGEQSTYHNVWFISTTNIANQHGRMNVDSNAKPTDGYLDVTIISNISRFNLFMLVCSNELRKKLKAEAIETFTCKSISIHPERSLYVQSDGEMMGESPVSVSVQKSRVALIK